MPPRPTSRRSRNSPRRPAAVPSAGPGVVANEAVMSEAWPPRSSISNSAGKSADLVGKLGMFLGVFFGCDLLPASYSLEEFFRQDFNGVALGFGFRHGRCILRLPLETGSRRDQSYRATRGKRSARRFDASGRIVAHRLLRRHGQELCNRSRPRCEKCPFPAQCPWPALSKHA